MPGLCAIQKMLMLFFVLFVCSIVEGISGAVDFSGDVYSAVSAVELGDENRLEYLIESGLDVNYEVRPKFTLLMLAATLGRERIVDVLLSNGAKIDPYNDNEVIRAACTNQHAGVIASLLKNGLSPRKLELRITNNESCVFVAIRNSDTKMIRVLIGAGINLSDANDYGDTPIDLSKNYLGKQEEILELIKEAKEKKELK